MFDEDLKKPCFNTFRFSNHDINKFIFLLWKGAYPHKYMDVSETISETYLHGKLHWWRLRVRKKNLK